MPILNVKVSAPRSSEMTRNISKMPSDLTKTILGKDPNVTSIAIEYVDPAQWIVGGRSLSEQGRVASNTKAEKAKYIREAFAAFSDLLGDLHHESYIYVQDVRAAAYGYGGETQEFRSAPVINRSR